MAEVIVYEMKYCGGKADSDISAANYRDENYDEYRKICRECFRDLSISANQDPDAFYSKEEMSEKKSDVFIAFCKNEIIGSVEIHGNIIDHLFVNKKFQNKATEKNRCFLPLSGCRKK